MGSFVIKRVPALAAVKRKSTKRSAAKASKPRRRVRSAAPPKKKKVIRKHAKKKVLQSKRVRKPISRKRRKSSSVRKSSITVKHKASRSTKSSKKPKNRHKDTKDLHKKSSSKLKKVTKKTPKSRVKKSAKVTKKKRSPRKSQQKTHVERFEARKKKFLEQIAEAKAVQLEVVEPIPEPPAIARVPIYKVEAGDVRGYMEVGGIEKFMHSSHANRSHPEETVKEVFEKAFIHNLKKGPFEADEVNIYRYGVVIRPREGIATDNLTDKIREIMSQYPGSSIHVVSEGNTFSIRLNFGDKRASELAGNVSADLQNNSGIIGDIYSLLEDRFGSTDWFAFWETEDAMYE